MRNDDVIAEWWLILFGQWWYQVLRHTNIHLRLNSQPSITYNGRFVVAKLKFLFIKKVTMTSQFRDELTFSSEVRTYWSHSQKSPTCQKSAFCDLLFLQSIRYRDIDIYKYKRASLACAARLADTMCPHESPFGRLATLFNVVLMNIIVLSLIVNILEHSLYGILWKMELFRNFEKIKVMMTSSFNDD